jgi:hypothetical protein
MQRPSGNSIGVLHPLRAQDLPELPGNPGAPVGRCPGKVVVTMEVNPQGVVGDPASVGTALVEGRQVAQDLGESDPVYLATAQNDRDTAPIQEVVDDNAHSLITTDPTARFPALEVGTHGFSRPTYRAPRKAVVAQRLHA